METVHPNQIYKPNLCYYVGSGGGQHEPYIAKVAENSSRRVTGGGEGYR